MASFDQLNSALQRVHGGGLYISDEVPQKVIDFYCQSDHDEDSQEALSSREREVLLLVNDGRYSIEKLGAAHVS